MSGFDKDRIYTSKSLHEELNAERARQGKSQIPVINPCKGGNANSLTLGTNIFTAPIIINVVKDVLMDLDKV